MPKKIPKIVCIYAIENIINNKKYIGKTTDFHTRIRKHLYNLRKNRHANNNLQQDFNIYGKNSFIEYILEICKVENLDNLESFYISEYNSTDYYFGYNIFYGGENHTVPPSVREKISKTKIERIKSGEIQMVGRKKTDEERLRMSEITKSFGWINEKNPNHKEIVCLNDERYFLTIKDASSFYNINRSEISTVCNHKAPFVNGLVFMFKEEYENTNKEDIAKMVNSAESFKRGQSSYKPVKNITTGKIYESITAASVACGVDPSTIVKNCKGKIKSCGKDPITGEKFVWKYV